MTQFSPDDLAQVLDDATDALGGRFTKEYATLAVSAGAPVSGRPAPHGPRWLRRVVVPSRVRATMAPRLAGGRRSRGRLRLGSAPSTVESVRLDPNCSGKVVSVHEGHARHHPIEWGLIPPLGGRGVGAEIAETLFIDDTAGHVVVAATLGIRGHVHLTTDQTIQVIRRFVANEP